MPARPPACAAIARSLDSVSRPTWTSLCDAGLGQAGTAPFAREAHGVAVNPCLSRRRPDVPRGPATMHGMPTRDQILEALKVVIDPELRRDIVELEMVRSIEIKDGGIVDVTVSLTTPGCPIKNHFETAVADAVQGVAGVSRANVGFDVLTDTEKGVLQRKLGRPGGLPEGALAQVSDVICIGSGKGGVGKSSLTVNLAAALRAEGKRVGVLDADVWGYSIPRMLGLGGQRPRVNGERKILPLE